MNFAVFLLYRGMQNILLPFHDLANLFPASPQRGAKKKEPYFSEPRLMMSVFGRCMVRFVAYSLYGILGAGTSIALLSDIVWLQVIGGIVAFFLIYRTRYIYRARASLRAQQSQSMNIADYLTPEAFRAVERAFDRAHGVGGDPFLHLLKVLLEKKRLRALIASWGVKPEIFEERLDRYLEQTLATRYNKTDLLLYVDIFLHDVLEYAAARKGEYITADDMFKTLMTLDNEHIQRLLMVCGLRSSPTRGNTRVTQR